MQPRFVVNGHDYTRYLAAEGLKPSKNDLDADGSGRNLIDGLMYRKKIASKMKWTVSFNRLTATLMAQIYADMDSDYVTISMLDPKTNAYSSRVYYCSTINSGVQRSIGGEVYYDGATFDITER